MKAARPLIGVISLVLVLAVVVWEWNYRTSPGPLNPTHATIAKLQGTEGCNNCHGDGDIAKPTAMVGACVSCHTEIKEQLATTRGLHGAIRQSTAQNCASCHAEHGGAKLQLVDARSFAAVGVPNEGAFDHSRLVKYELTGRHSSLRCEQCHVNARAAVLAEGQKRFIGLAQDCASCHKDPHEGTYGPDCGTCHGQVHEFKVADGFSHEQFALEGGHSNLKCEKCHEKTGVTSVLALRSTAMEVRTCAACHTDPHEGTLGPNCASCHSISKPFDQADQFKHTEEFALIGGHSELACVRCHEKTGANSVAALQANPQPVRACQACHTSPHRSATLVLASTSSGKSQAESCVVCHRVEEKTFLFPAATMTAELHKASGFALDPPHEKVECAACHKEMGNRPALAMAADLPQHFAAIYPGRAQQACESCHADPHGGQFATAPSQGKCIACHAATHFIPNTFDQSQHEKTRFPLTGAHKAVACVLCHKKQEEITRFVGVSTSCSQCHADVHRGEFDAPGRPGLVGGRDGCARCHTTSGFREIQWTAADHALWTKYPLNGLHAKASCTDCHRRSAQPDARGRTLGIAPTSCIACHSDPHAGQFAQQNVTDCARCHNESAKFTSTTFDHQRDSAFKLDEQHVKLACAACHRPVEIAPQTTVIRYRPLGTRCQDCHDPRTLRGQEVP